MVIDHVVGHGADRRLGVRYLMSSGAFSAQRGVVLCA
jgi:hypothetical protein